MKTVLIVEDEKLIRQGIRTMVQRSGVPIEVIMECNNGEAALDILKDQKVDVMFTDIRMPKMDGLELVREVQKLSHKPQIVAVSGYDDFAYAVELLRHGVREYILKPVEREKPRSPTFRRLKRRMPQRYSCWNRNTRSDFSRAVIRYVLPVKVFRWKNARTRCIWMNLGTEMYAFVRLIWHGSCRRMNCGRNAPV